MTASAIGTLAAATVTTAVGALFGLLFNESCGGNNLDNIVAGAIQGATYVKEGFEIGYDYWLTGVGEISENWEYGAQEISSFYDSFFGQSYNGPYKGMTMSQVLQSMMNRVQTAIDNGMEIRITEDGTAELYSFDFANLSAQLRASFFGYQYLGTGTITEGVLRSTVDMYIENGESLCVIPIVFNGTNVYVPSSNRVGVTSNYIYSWNYYPVSGSGVSTSALYYYSSLSGSSAASFFVDSINDPLYTSCASFSYVLNDNGIGFQKLAAFGYNESTSSIRFYTQGTVVPATSFYDFSESSKVNVFSYDESQLFWVILPNSYKSSYHWSVSDLTFDLSYDNTGVLTHDLEGEGFISKGEDQVPGLVSGWVVGANPGLVSVGTNTNTGELEVSVTNTATGEVTETLQPDDLQFDIDTPQLIDKFPFSLPFDLYRLLTIFVADPVEPIFHIPIKGTIDVGNGIPAEVDEEVVIDCTIMKIGGVDVIQALIRFGFLAGFIAFLIHITPNITRQN